VHTFIPRAANCAAESGGVDVELEEVKVAFKPRQLVVDFVISDKEAAMLNPCAKGSM
jgi:hypothetical protein